MNIKQNLFVFCESFIKDDKGRVSLINIYDTVGGKQLPIPFSNFKAVINIDVSDVNEAEVIDLEFKIVAPSGKNIIISTQRHEVPASSWQTQGIIMEVPLVNFDEEGAYKVQARLGQYAELSQRLRVAIDEAAV